MSKEIEILERQLERAIKSRKQAEAILEAKALELYEANQSLLQLNSRLEKEVQDRTEKLRSSEIKYRSIIENMELGLMEVDNDGIITRVYERFNEMTGYSSDELVGYNAIEKLLVPGFEKVIKEEDNKRLKGQTGVYELKIRKKDGSEIWVLISGAPFYDAKGKIIGSIGVHYDISAQKKLQFELEVARKQAIKAQQAEKQFLANMSHEIRTPLNAIIGMTHLLQETNLNEEQSEYLDLLHGSANILMHLISDILDISKIDANAIEVQQKPFDLRDLTRNLIDTFALKGREKNVECLLKFDPQIDRSIIGDPQLLNQILINLLGNAHKFTEAGFIQLIVTLLEKGPTSFLVKFEVKDTGIGISADQIELIFEQFKQASGEIRTAFGGTGLGLTISSRLVKLLGGELKVSSQLGVGASFFFNLKLKKGTKLNSQRIKSNISLAPIENFNSHQLLIVEDNEINLKYISTLLTKWKIEFKIARNGKDAFELYLSETFDLIFMDLQMPIMDGVTATKMIRQLSGKKSKVPIIALTASTFLSKKNMVLNAGMTDFLSKPFTPNQLLKLLHKYLGIGPDYQTIEEKIEYLDDGLMQSFYGDDIEYAYTIFETFLVVVDDEMDLLASKIQRAEWEDIQKQAHKLKPTFSMVGLPEITSKMEVLEKKANTNDIQGAKEIFIDIQNQLEQMLPQIKKEKERLEKALDY